MKQYPKDIFENNVKILLQYDYEPEIEIIFSNGKKMMLIIYKDFIDVFDENGECSKLKNVNEFISKINWEEIICIKDLDGLDFSQSIQNQSTIIDGKLWLK